QRLYVGRSATINVTLSAPAEVLLPKTADVVFVDRNPEQVLPMTPGGGGRFFLPLEQVTIDRRFYIHTPEGRSRLMDLAVLPVPTFEKTVLHYDFPAYTKWPQVSQPLSEDGIRALAGTRVAVEIDSNLALRHGELRLWSKAEKNSGTAPTRVIKLLPLAPGGASVTGSFEIQDSGRFELSLTSTDGTASDQNLTGSLIALPDRAPQVQLLEPDLRVVAPVGFQVPVAVSASDDIGLSRTELHQQMGGDSLPPQSLELKWRGPTYASSKAVVDLAALEAQAGDEIRGFATAYDNHPDPPQSADSPIFTIRVISVEEYKDLARQQIGVDQIAGEFDRFLEELKKLNDARKEMIEQLEDLKAKAEKGPLSAADQKALGELRRKLDEYARRSQDLADAMDKRSKQPPLYEFEAPYQELLKKIAGQLARQAEGAKPLPGQITPPTPANLSKALDELRKQQGDADKQAQPLRLTEEQMKLLEKAQTMLAEAQVIIAIAEQQREIADHLASYKQIEVLNSRDQGRADRLADEQDHLRKELEDSLKRLEKAAQACLSDLPKMSAGALEVVEAIRGKGVTNDQNASSKQARASNGPQAWALADSAATKLESMIKECKGGMQGDAMQDLDGAFGLSKGALGQCLSQMSANARAQAMKGSMGQGLAGGQGSAAGGSGSSAGNPQAGTLVGPHTNVLGESSSDRPGQRSGPSFRRAGDGRGGSEDGAGSAQSLNPEIDAARRIRGGSGLGVPLRYRGLAEQYFRRLAEDQAPRP
ncbi:MAG: hypothetical protein OER86_11360, partial [Phycisphaerae bacterium]|nr:hypothetical protein [Phycisphaerae bacterium]